MSARPWMPLYVAEYLADTAHLSASESGAYLHLIMHYWLNKGLPTDDRLLARIARLTPTQWKSARPILVEFFDEDWKHGRIEFELTEAARISAAGRVGGKASGEARRRTKDQTINQRSSNDRSNDHPTKSQALHLPSQTQREERKQDAAIAAAPTNGSAKPMAPADNQKRDYYQRFAEVWGGSNTGAMATNLLKVKGSVAKARAALEAASEAGKPRDYIGAIIRGAALPAEGYLDPHF